MGGVTNSCVAGGRHEIILLQWQHTALQTNTLKHWGWCLTPALRLKIMHFFHTSVFGVFMYPLGYNKHPLFPYTALAGWSF